MAYSSLAAPSPFPSKSLFTCLSVLDEEESPSESGSPCILLDSDDIGDRQERLKQDIKSPAHRTQRRTTDSFSQVRVCSLQALSRSSKKLLPRMSFSSPNIMRGKSNNKRPQTEKATKSRGGGGVSQNDLTNVKLEMLNMHLDTKNEEVAKLKALLQQSEQKVVLLESKMTSLEEELKQQRQPPPPILEMSFGSNFEYNTDHCSNSEYDTDQTMSHLPDEMLEDLTGQLQDKRQEIDALEDEVEQWQEQANEWKNKYQSMVEQMHNGTVSEEESVNTSNISFSVDYEKDSPRSKVEEVDGRASTDNNIRSSNDDTNSPLRRSSIDSDEKMSENGPVSKHSLRNRTPLSVSALQNVQTPERCSRRRQKTKRYTPAAAAANTVVNKVKEISTAPKTDDTSEESVEFGEVGHKFSKYFGSRWGSYSKCRLVNLIAQLFFYHFFVISSLFHVSIDSLPFSCLASHIAHQMER